LYKRGRLHKRLDAPEANDTSSINRFVLAGLSVPFITPDDSVSALPASRASPVGGSAAATSAANFRMRRDTGCIASLIG
jgi:hypothetical protein